MCAVFAVQILRLGNMNSLLRGDIPVMHHIIRLGGKFCAIL